MKGSPTARGVNRVAEFPSRSCRPQMRRRSGRSSESAMTLLELVAACAKAGRKIEVPEREIRPGIRIAIVEDPDGNWVEFLQTA